MRLSRRQSAARNDRNSTVVVPFPVPKSDVGLVTSLKAGHPDAVQVLCERYSGELLRVAARILGPDEALGAVVAEALESSLEALDQLNEPRALRIWLVSRLVIAARQRIRARRRWRWLVAHKQVCVLPEAQRYSERLLASYRVLDRLSDDQRIVFCLVIIHSMGLVDAASALGKSLTQVRTLLERACGCFALYSEVEPSISGRRLRSA